MLFSAGVLPYTIYEDGTVYLLLGKDKDGYWSDFGGRAEPYEREAAATASREFFEETLGVILSQETMRKILKYSRNYKLIRSQTMKGSPYIMYIVRVPYKNYPETFSLFHNFIRKSKHCNQKKLLEKTEIKWFSLENVLASLQFSNRNQLIHLRNVFQNTISRERSTICSYFNNVNVPNNYIDKKYNYE